MPILCLVIEFEMRLWLNFMQVATTIDRNELDDDDNDDGGGGVGGGCGIDSDPIKLHPYCCPSTEDELQCKITISIQPQRHTYCEWDEIKSSWRNSHWLMRATRCIPFIFDCYHNQYTCHETIQCMHARIHVYVHLQVNTCIYFALAVVVIMGLPMDLDLVLVLALALALAPTLSAAHFHFNYIICSFLIPQNDSKRLQLSVATVAILCTASILINSHSESVCIISVSVLFIYHLN